MSDPTPKDAFLQSVQRCVDNDAFIPVFYERFMASSEEVRRKFRFTDLEKQKEMLVRSLQLCAGATAGEAEALAEMKERAQTHDRMHLNIEPSLYDDWLESIIATATEFDKEWDESIEEAWRKILGYVIRHMSREY